MFSALIHFQYVFSDYGGKMAAPPPNLGEHHATNGLFTAKFADCFYVARYVLIDVSFRESIQTNIECSKISPFVHGNISTNSVAKNY